MPTAGLPRAQAQISDQRGYPTREWYAFFSRLLDESTDAGLSAQIQSILDRLNQLEAGSIADLSIIGLDSVSVIGQPSSGRVTITLDGDTTSPGALCLLIRPLLCVTWKSHTGHLTCEIIAPRTP